MMDKSNEKNYDIGNILIFGLVLVLIVLGTYNAINNPIFLEMNAGSILTLLVAIVFAYFLNQQKLDERKKKDQIERLLLKMQTSISSNIVITVQSDDDIRYNSMFQRAFDNKLNILRELNSKLIDKEILKYISDNFNDYKDTIGDNIQSFNKLKEVEMKLNRLIQNIDSKLDELLLSLYKL